MSVEASCVCGGLSLVVDGVIGRTSMCHCFACQKRTGSVFGVQVRLEEENVRIVGSPSEYLRVGDAGGEVRSYFCPTCGSTLYWKIDALPGLVMAAVGAFAKPDMPAPTCSVYKARKHHWVEIPGSVTEDWD